MLFRSLEKIAREGANAIYQGEIAHAIAACVTRNGGALAAGDLAGVRVDVARAQAQEFAEATVHGARRDSTGYGILCDALAALDPAALGENRGGGYARTMVTALRTAWQRRAQTLTPAAAGHTTHLGACDGDGMLASMTFTHGPTWFGAGLFVEEAGIVLNSGANLFIQPRQGGAPRAVHNMSPVIVEHRATRHAMGSPGGAKIPAIVMQMIVDAVHYGLPLADAIGLPRVSVAPDGGAEAEAGLMSAIPADLAPRAIDRNEYYGPASALTRDAKGGVHVARDPRF